MKPYKEYKTVDLEWVKEIPTHWDVMPNISLFEERIERGHDELQMLAVTIKNGVITQQELLENSSKKDSSNDDKSKYKRVNVGDLAYNKMRMWQGAVGHSAYEGIVSPAYIVLKPREDIVSKYYHYLYRTPLYTEVSYQNSYGIHKDQLSLRYKDFKRMYTILPPLREQQVIVEYLDNKVEELDTLISTENEKIEVLKEYKKALIDQVVFGGIESYEKQKTDEIWLKSIPSEWSLCPLKTIVREVNNSRSDIKENEVYIALDQIESGTGRFSYVGGEVEFDSKVKEFKDTDILFCKLRPYLAKVVFPKCEGVCVGELLVLRPISKDVDPEFLHYLLLSPSFINLVNSSTYGAKMPRANWGFIGNQKVPIPDTKEEQKKIVDYLNEKIEGIDKLIEQTQLKISEVESYKETLITNVVTGKIDVKNLVNDRREVYVN
ncbi:restriction endonuclease subunit S [Bacillus badius]|uniref:restriction endonuclease subunit S n=1 Tax=Bacillus badius TaxID=1455 RepID=UPI001CC13B56|nr:restriction endonuclease subunit S [Bacillus badius]UAT31459.1 restriction endonuclease subunit S [Bacillus badius]